MRSLLIRSFFALALASGGMVLADVAEASGGSRGGYGSGNSSRSNATYDRGKALFQGRAAGHRGLSVCFVADEGLVKLSRQTVKPLRRSSVSAFAGRLVDCAVPERRIAQTLSNNDLAALVHYLNERYSLRLRG